MDDLIKRQDAVRAVTTRDGCGRCEKVIKNIPSAQQWIPCSERLPEESGDYLVTDDSGLDARVEKAWFMWCDDGSAEWEYVNVTAWMPLPDVYKGEEE